MDSRGGKEGTGNAVRNLGSTVADKIAENVRRHSLYRRPSIPQANSTDNIESPGGLEVAVDTAPPLRDSLAAPSQEPIRRVSMRRPSRAPASLAPPLEQKGTERQSTAATLNEEEDLEKIMSLQYTINFDVVFACDYNQK